MTNFDVPVNEKALEAASEVVMRLDREGIIDVDDGILKENELVDWIARIIHDVYHPKVDPEALADAILEFGEGDSSAERLREY